MRSHGLLMQSSRLVAGWASALLLAVGCLSSSVAAWDGKPPPVEPANPQPPRATEALPPGAAEEIGPATAPAKAPESPTPAKLPDQKSDAPSPVPQSVPGQFEARFVDRSALKLIVRDEKVELVTPYGKLLIPLADITRIELGVRVPAELLKRIGTLIAQLGHDDFERREAAGAELARLGDRAAPALRKALTSDTPEIARRAKELLAKLQERKDGEEESQEPRPEHDVIHTRTSTIAGTVTAASLKVTTTQFGEVELKLSDVRELRGPELKEEEEDGEVINDPGTLYQFGNHVGKTLRIRVTGAAQQTGGLYGTDLYTGDTTVACAAVHAGVIKPGQTKVLKVKILGPQAGFTGSVRNGMSSSSYGSYSTSYKFVK